uniref:VCBS repeat-containing protein n=1 Tax=Grammatophora oceanica TaxID=210454 RepID=A0A7S1VJH1_9STRA
MMDFHDTSYFPTAGKFHNSYWTTQYGNLGSGLVAGWYINPGDRYVVGNFDTSHPGHELLAISSGSKYASFMSYSSGVWSSSWSNLGNDQIRWWYLNSDDHYLSGNFDGLPGDELLAIREASGNAHLMKWTGTDWTTIWATGGGQIHWWIFRATDKCVAADFDDDGQDEVLCTNHLSKWAQLMKYDRITNTWTLLWSNSGSGQIHSWYLNSPDVFIVGDFDGTPGDELLVYNRSNGWSRLIKFTSGVGFQWIWGNGGHGRLHDPIALLSGKFSPASSKRESLLSISDDRWAYVESYRFPSQIIDFAP